jgi:hypothetical protein
MSRSRNRGTRSTSRDHRRRSSWEAGQRSSVIAIVRTGKAGNNRVLSPTDHSSGWFPGITPLFLRDPIAMPIRISLV